MGSGQSVTGKRDVALVDEVAEAAQFATAGGVETNDLATRVEVSVSCRELKRRINAVVAVVTREASDDRWSEVGQTEMIPDTLSPGFVRSIVLRFAFEVQQRMRLELYHIPSGRPGVGSRELIGISNCFLAEIIAGRNGQIRRLIEGSEGAVQGEMFIAAEEVGRKQNLVMMDVRVEALPATDLFSRSCDPYVLLNRTNPALRPEEPGYKAPVYRGEVVRRSLHPRWERMLVTEQQLCRSDESRLVELEIFDWNSSSSHELVGSASTTFADIKKCFAMNRRLSLQLLKDNPQRRPAAAASVAAASDAKKKKNKKKKVAQRRYLQQGRLHIENVFLERQYTFLDYVLGGLEVALIVGVDFSRSNGDPSFPESLHFLNTDEPNDYVMAIKALGEILEHYDTDKQYPIYGFGAKMPPAYALGSNCFSLKGNYFDPDVSGVQGIVDAYRDALQAVRLHGPTSLAPVVQLAGKWAETAEEDNATEASKYFILMIITDGDVTDMQKTIDTIVKCSRLPLSIVIVGVGQSDFEDLKVLDADDKALFSVEEQKFMERDIVQFVPFDEYKDRSYHELAMATLDEVPRELVSFFRKRNIVPKAEAQAEKESHAVFVNQFKKKANDKIPKFLREERDRLIKAVSAQGYNPDDAARFIHAGVPTPDPMHLIEVMAHHATKTNTKNKSNGGSSASAAQTVYRRNLKSVFASAIEAIQGQNQLTNAATSNLSLCALCQTRAVAVKFLPCSHSVTCAQCANELGVLCPVCRVTIERILPVA